MQRRKTSELIYELASPRMPKPDKDIMREKNYRPISPTGHKISNAKSSLQDISKPSVIIHQESYNMIKCI